MLTVLITGCSMHSYDLISELRNNYDNEPVKIVGINCEDTALLRKGVDAGYVVHRITEPEYWNEMISICNKENVDVIFPFITAELPLIADRRKRIESECGAKVSVSSRASLDKVSNKIALSKTYSQYMPKQKIVRTESEVWEFLREVGYPEKSICCKLPDRCGGLGFCILDERIGKDITIYNKFGINRYITFEIFMMLFKEYGGEMILQEYEEGNDYSLCILADNGKIAFALGFESYLTVFGSAMFAKIKNEQNAIEIAEKVTRESCLDGNACFDFMLKPDGSVKLLEVNPRLSATLPFIAHAGLNLPYLRCKQLLGADIYSYKPEINYDLRMSKNYESEYFI